MDKIYMCIDLKSFYASVECVERGLDALKARLVVADPSRGRGAICLAVSPALKEMGVKNRCRVFEIPDSIDYICALPRMKKYMEVSAKIYKIYLKYVSKDDIHVYSIDECFLDVTKYLKLYGISAKELAKRIIDDVFLTTSITATCGIGTNLFLAKVALDVISKHASDNIGYLNEDEFKDKIWHLKPITSIWGISRGTEARLLKHGITDLYGITQIDEEILYKEFGINAELLIDHANGIETCTIEDIHNYKPKNNSMTSQQVLFENYKYSDALLVLKEMVDLICLDLVEKDLVTNTIGLFIGYSDKSYNDYSRDNGAGGSKKLSGFTCSREKIMEAFVKMFEAKVDKTKLVRRIGITLSNLVSADYASIDLFSDLESEEKEKNLQEAIIAIRNRFGKNSLLKGMNLEQKATTIKRNRLIGGHNASEDE